MLEHITRLLLTVAMCVHSLSNSSLWLFWCSQHAEYMLKFKLSSLCKFMNCNCWDYSGSPGSNHDLLWISDSGLGHLFLNKPLWQFVSLYKIDDWGDRHEHCGLWMGNTQHPNIIILLVAGLLVHYLFFFTLQITECLANMKKDYGSKSNTTFGVMRLNLRHTPVLCNQKKSG